MYRRKTTKRQIEEAREIYINFYAKKSKGNLSLWKVQPTAYFIWKEVQKWEIEQGNELEKESKRKEAESKEAKALIPQLIARLEPHPKITNYIAKEIERAEKRGERLLREAWKLREEGGRCKRRAEKLDYRNVKRWVKEHREEWEALRLKRLEELNLKPRTPEKRHYHRLTPEDKYRMGKYKDIPLCDIKEIDLDYFNWIIEKRKREETEEKARQEKLRREKLGQTIPEPPSYWEKKEDLKRRGSSGYGED